MNLKNNLGIKKAQTTVEYLVLFAIIAMLTLLGITTFFPRFRSVLGETNTGTVVANGFFNRSLQALR
jgi:competence protein ComGC